MTTKFIINWALIEATREHKNITKTHLTNSIGVNRSTYHRWINNEVEPSVIKFLELCELLELDINNVIIKVQ